MDVAIKIWEDSILPDFNDNLVIHFEPLKWNDGLENIVSLNIFWKKNKHDNHKPTEIFSSGPCVIHHTFKNGIFIKGKLEIKKFRDFNSTDTLGIFADLYYYKKENENYLWHTEGFLISFNPETFITDEIENTIIIDESVIDKAETTTTVEVTSDIFSDLFPYIYTSGWPKSSTSEQLWNFIHYKALPLIKGSLDSSFHTKLASLKFDNKRELMQEEAIHFIEGIKPYKNNYVTNVGELEGDIGKFKSFYNILYKEKNLRQVVGQVSDFFNTDTDNFSIYLESHFYLKNKQKLWESYFALIIEMGYENKNLIAIIKVITLCNFLEKVYNNLDSSKSITILSNKKLLSLFHATIILDKVIFPLPPYALNVPDANLILPYAIGDLQLVKYKLSRYEIGELASITSIMPGEKRKLVNRKLDRVIDKEVSKTISITESAISSNENNNNFSEELWNAIAETTETTNYPDPGLVSSYGPPTNITIKGEYSKTHKTQTPDKKQLSSFAKKILNKTTKRLSEKVNKVRAHTELKELEDTSVSFINNTNNNEPVYGIYYWLNKIYQTKVINYGNRMLFSFIVPNPAEFLNGNKLEPPKSLKDSKIGGYADITKDNYLELAHDYNLKKFPLCPQDIIVVSDIVDLSESKLISLPDLYYASTATIEYVFGTGDKSAKVNGFLGQQKFSLSQSKGDAGNLVIEKLDNEQGRIVISSVYDSSTPMSTFNSEINFKMGVNISCFPLTQTILAWKIEFYQLLNEAYLIQMAAYNLKIGRFNTKKGNVNPLVERMTVKLELEKNIRKQLLQKALSVKGLTADAVVTDLNSNRKYNEPELIEYLNNALEWDEMSYTFFDDPYDPDSHFSAPSLSPDFFSAFHNASYARVIIPILPKFNYGFLYFLNTGIVWTSQDRLAPCFEDTIINPDQVSILNKVKKVFNMPKLLEETVDSWEVQIPTSMQILQNKKHLKIKNHE